ncbi:putative cytokinetic ring protein SteA [Aneurinibacillus migulanus]|uniref:Uncharacterized membrane-anchored protein n=1 Tax=Aneurinibacillus migulanus TaxID=47500 RepID=A0A1G8HG92_ANEMI|nr:putative cytokinetic ring protein SteA [Aneurinibacillus migulanus]MCP1354318.1 putative cytokinetic ring protein SteA [Aneurinibacillus migulanus]MED0891412.1 putative cytokinetic ring protein SteA [Aneurinibacillus migulanus]MED1613899.1 putative cytokinetic ring protein SteA [Aneurinibacillus migulanus]MED4728820.1 putative cytokinetic ring protein SteA [Aneurinibacillus migulanus]SDI05541.1 Uncharacterized membrane-anchored protein [Aneurinibacillus migulanus]
MFMRLGRNSHTVCGPVRYGRITKHMAASLRPGDIAVIEHTDIDELAARELIEKKVKAVVNCAVSFTGEYEAQGARLLLDTGIPLYDCPAQSRLPGEISNGEEVVIDGHYLFRKRDKMMLTRLLPVTHEEWQVTYQKAEKNTSERLARFIDNTLHYALREKEYLFCPLASLPLHTKIPGRHAVVVSRGRHYEEDLQALRNYITVYRPVLIGVDGGGDALLAQGWRPDIIMGDMDSVSDRALRETKDIIVHAYTDGRAPGEERVKSLGVPYHLLRAPGTSEDMALLYAYDNGVSLIVGIGTHTSMEDFLEKNRQGMASTLLVRMKVGSKLVDARGIHHLYSPFTSVRLPLFRHLKMLMQMKR